MYDSPDAYYGVPATNLVKDRQPREAFCLQSLRPTAFLGVRDHVLRLRASKNVSTTKSWRFYTDYAEMGSLHEVITKHLGFDDLGTTQPREKKILPEEFLVGAEPFVASTLVFLAR